MHESDARNLDGRRSARGALVAALTVLALVPAAADAAPAPAKVRLLSPTSATQVGGTIDIQATAAASVPAVRFQGRWTDADGVRRWHTIGTDRVASNGFSMRWSSAALKEQKAVYLRAVTLTRAGRVAARSASVRLSVPAATPAPAPVEESEVAGQSVAAVRQTVKGTCAATAECRANTRSGPGTSYARTGQVKEGDKVDVVCQGTGETVVTLGGVSSVWNKLSDGSWISDLYLDTAGKPGFSPAITRC